MAGEPVAPSPDALALRIASRLRHGDCPHGIPDRVKVEGGCAPWGEHVWCRPLCDACVMAAVREALNLK